MLCNHSFWTISIPSKITKNHHYFENLKREPFITESISSLTVRKNKLVAKKKNWLLSTYHRPPKFFLPFGKIGPKCTPSTTTTSSWENNHEYQYHPSAITPDLTISFSQKISWISKRKRKRKHIYYQKFIISHFHL